MTIEIVNKIESLPPLPKSIHELNEFKTHLQKEPEQLLKIIEKDALVIATLLKISNSAMFGFRSKVESPSRVINLLGVDFTLSVAISSIINDLIKTDLHVYGVSNDDFMNASTLSTSLANVWLSQIDCVLKDELILPALLQETGKFIISDIISSNGKSQEFKEQIHSGKEISVIEKELVGFTTSEVTAMVFKHWKLSDELIELIKNVDSLENCNEEYVQKAQMLHIIKTVCSVADCFGAKQIELAVQKAQTFNLDEKKLTKAIEKLQDRILDAM